MKGKFNKRTLIRWKVYIDRSKMYIGYIQFLLIIFVFINSLENNPVSQFVIERPLMAVPVILVLFVVCSLILGYLDSKLGFREEEIRNHAFSNPVLRQIQLSIDELNTKIDTIDKENRSGNNEL
ncbi:hypothetical protein R1T43_09370 [Alteromonas sp. CI.11.F.A3]|uniref:hypothetical protein n=1 Tax=Alteromonas TaxID=226 RepID=UPI0007B4329C|nr:MULTISPECIES: hypothetical protein [Alteromonas]ANB23947.1 hypothetical protein A6F57_01200 [Alteromonas stellipolaris]MBQ4831591.1 hypothetical protein [Alteromonas sp. MMG017]WOI39214.1 hypothetical protein R1T43_09370 [Alteromonas sp. CI.11.F.A3]